MLRKLVIATAFGLAAPVAAQEAATISASQPAAPAPSEVILADQLEDASIVSLEGNYDQQIWENGAPLEAMMADLNEIGRVEDVALSPGGQMLGLTTDVGGFLGIGDKTVLIPLEDIRLVRPADGGEITIITRLGLEPLRDLPEFDAEE